MDDADDDDIVSSDSTGADPPARLASLALHPCLLHAKKISRVLGPWIPKTEDSRL